MKNVFYLVFVVVSLLVVSNVYGQTGVSINTSGTAPDANAVLDVSSTTQGVQLPRLTTSQAATLALSLDAADDGMIVYDTDLKTFKFWDGNLLDWTVIGTGSSGAQNLDQAYDGGGSGLGRTITADAGNVEIQDAGFLTVESNVGIGTTAPAEKLEIQVSGRGGMLIEGDNSQDLFIQMTNDVSGSNYIYTDQSESNFLKLESGSGKDIEFLTDGANERMAVQSDGRVRVNNLADPNSAVVISNPAGILGKSALTGNATDVLLGTGVFGPASAFDDHDWYQTLSTNQPSAISDWIYTTGRVGIGVGASSNPEAPLHVAATGSGNPHNNSVLAANPNNTAGNDAILATRVAGSSAGDPFVSLDIAGEAGWSLGIDNDHGNRFKLAPSYNNLSSSTAMTVLTNGNVGIGTTDPDQKLQVQGIARSRGSYMIDVDGANGSGPRIALGTTSDVYAFLNLGAYSGINNLETKDRDFRIGSNSVFNAMYVQNATGNVGIGTNTPYALLNVASADRSRLFFTREDSNTTTGEELGSIYFDSTDDTAPSSTDASVVIRANASQNHGNSNKGGYLSILTKNNVGNGSAATERLRVAANGNVGVGESNPAQKLHVVGTGRFTNLGGSGNRVVYANNSGDLITSTSNINPNSLIDGSGTVNYLARWTPDGNTLGIGATYDNGTNVGIGTTSTPSRLTVNGGIGRTAHNNGHLEGSYNNVGGNSTYTNPIYTIGTNYNPSVSTLDNMYGIGYSHTNASFITDPGPDTWGMYVAADGDARIWLGASSGASSYFNAGNIGFGTATPASIFHISTSQTGNVSKLHNPTLANGSLVGHEFGKANSTNNMAEFRYNHISDGNSGNWINLGLWGNANTLNVVGTGNVGIGTTSPGAKLEVDDGQNTEVRVISDDNGASTISAYGGSQGTGRVYVGQSASYGGGIEYNGDNSPGTTGAGADYVTLFRRANGTDYWTARNYYNNDNWQFRGNVDVEGYLTVGNPTTGSQTKRGAKTFFEGGTHTLYGGTVDYDFDYTKEQLVIPSGASNFRVRHIAFQMSGLHHEGDEDFHIFIDIGGNTAGIVWSGGGTLGMGGNNQYMDWNFGANMNWLYTTNQTVRWELYEENETCWGCDNEETDIFDVKADVFYEYTKALSAGDISASGRIYANSSVEVGDVAEYFPVTGDFEIGDIISFVPGNDNHYEQSVKSYDSFITGVVSENPSVVLNDPESGEPLALAGRVKVNLAPGQPPIKSGDFLTSSQIPGKAMKATKAGTVIGYAVTDQAPGQNYVMVLLQPGKFHVPQRDENAPAPRTKHVSRGK